MSLSFFIILNSQPKRKHDMVPLQAHSTWRVAGCVGAGPQGSAAGGGIAGVMPEVGRGGQGCPGTGERAKG